MTWVVPLALGAFAILLMVFFTFLASRRGQRTTVAPAKLVGNRVLVHDINDDRCTGCDACVAVCPTNVLDLIANKSRVLRFQDCIQCEACMFACPTEALVMYPAGTTPPPLKVPEIDESFQTVVPGQYLIGEVAGKPLVKNAANLGRMVVEHMLATGLRPGTIGTGEQVVDVAIVGSGPGGLSAALTCIQRGLSYVVLEKEHVIASTIARYPKGKLVMAEPYDTLNLSLLPVFDASKEQLIPIWQELFVRVGLRVRQGESVEAIDRGPEGAFAIRTTVSTFRAQRVVLSIGTRGKPRTLQVPGENLPKVFNLLQDPDEWRERWVLVVGGGDSACEAALALADAGARVIVSYRGKSFNRAAPKNKQSIEQYAAEQRIMAKMGSQVVSFDPEGVTLALGDGTQQRYANHAAFVLIGADPPVSWLEKMGIKFVERPHNHQLGKTDDLLRRFAPRAIACPEDAPRAAALVLGQPVAPAPAPAMPAQAMPAPPAGEPSRPKKWLQSATHIFSSKPSQAPSEPSLSMHTVMMQLPSGNASPVGRQAHADATVLARAPRSFGPAQPGSGLHHIHSGHGRRDQLSAAERTRILRMLRDDGGGNPDAIDYDGEFGGPDGATVLVTPSTVRSPVPTGRAVSAHAPELAPMPDQPTVLEQPGQRWLTQSPTTQPQEPSFDEDGENYATIASPNAFDE